MEQNKDNTFGIIIVLVVAAIIVYLLFTLFGNDGTAVNQNGTTDADARAMQETVPNNNDGNQGGYDSQTTITSTTTTTTPNASNGTDTAFTVNVGDLPEAQQALLKTAGISGDEIVITNDMKMCAESSVGAERTKEIAGGAKPTMVEGAKLVMCYNQ